MSDNQDNAPTSPQGVDEKAASGCPVAARRWPSPRWAWADRGSAFTAAPARACPDSRSSARQLAASASRVIRSLAGTASSQVDSGTRRASYRW